MAKSAKNPSNGAALTGKYIAGCMALRPGFNLSSAEAIKGVVSIPVIAVGKLTEPYQIENALTSNKADFIAIGRGSIAELRFPEKMAADKFDEITPLYFLLSDVSATSGCHPRKWYDLSCQSLRRFWS